MLEIEVQEGWMEMTKHFSSLLCHSGPDKFLLSVRPASFQKIGGEEKTASFFLFSFTVIDSNTSQALLLHSLLSLGANFLSLFGLSNWAYMVSQAESTMRIKSRKHKYSTCPCL